MALIYLDKMPKTTPNDVIALFGGSFNPPHEGHLLVAHYALTHLPITALWWMVTPGNPFKDNSFLPSVESRIDLSAHLLKDEAKIVITGFEKTINAFNSFDTIKYVLDNNRTVKFIWIMGADNLIDFHKWDNWRKIVNMLPIAIVNRPNVIEPHFNTVFAKEYKDYYVMHENLAATTPPCWTYLQGPVSHQSSTQLRKKFKL